MIVYFLSDFMHYHNCDFSHYTRYYDRDWIERLKSRFHLKKWQTKTTTNINRDSGKLIDFISSPMQMRFLSNRKFIFFSVLFVYVINNTSVQVPSKVVFTKIISVVLLYLNDCRQMTFIFKERKLSFSIQNLQWNWWYIDKKVKYIRSNSLILYWFDWKSER